MPCVAHKPYLRRGQKQITMFLPAELVDALVKLRKTTGRPVRPELRKLIEQLLETNGISVKKPYYCSQFKRGRPRKKK